MWISINVALMTVKGLSLPVLRMWSGLSNLTALHVLFECVILCPSRSTIVPTYTPRGVELNLLDFTGTWRVLVELSCDNDICSVLSFLLWWWCNLSFVLLMQSQKYMCHTLCRLCTVYFSFCNYKKLSFCKQIAAATRRKWVKCKPANILKDKVIRNGIIMVALCNRADHNIFILFLLLLSSFFSSPNLSGRRLDVYHTLAHGVALVRI